MRFWSNAQWYPVLTRGKDLIFVGDWNLYPVNECKVEMIHCSGVRCTAEIEADCVARVKGEQAAIDLLDNDVKLALQDLLNLE